MTLDPELLEHWDGPPTGLLLVDKPEWKTSMAACRRVRSALARAGAPKRVKVGHGGTLDPFATGLLVLMTGRATRLCDQIMAGDKRYTATIDLAHTSPTDDTESEPIPARVEHHPTLARIIEALEAFTGEIMQAPPAHSAIMVDGKRAYELARAGELESLPKRPILIHELSVISYEWPKLILDIKCGKGVYIRSLARDLGEALGTGGMLTALRRTEVGRFSVKDALDWPSIPDRLTQEDLIIIPEVEAIFVKAKSQRAWERGEADPADSDADRNRP